MKYLDLLLNNDFEFKDLSIPGIDNSGIATAGLEQSVLHGKSFNGNSYLANLHVNLLGATLNKRPYPIVRFADGEYFFYSYSLACNGLYQQANSIESIKNVMPFHIDALKYVSENGILSPHVWHDTQSSDFLDFLNDSNISLTSSNYIPFYVIYAYLTSRIFTQLASDINICIVNNEFNEQSINNWFNKVKSKPKSITFVPIPSFYVSITWPSIKDSIIDKIPNNTDLCLVGAGVGALLVCSDISRKLSIPSIDAGHVINLMNDRLDKSNGHRLYTIWKES